MKIYSERLDGYLLWLCESLFLPGYNVRPRLLLLTNLGFLSVPSLNLDYILPDVLVIVLLSCGYSSFFSNLSLSSNHVLQHVLYSFNLHVCAPTSVSYMTHSTLFYLFNVSYSLLRHRFSAQKWELASLTIKCFFKSSMRATSVQCYVCGKNVSKPLVSSTE